MLAAHMSHILNPMVRVMIIRFLYLVFFLFVLINFLLSKTYHLFFLLDNFFFFFFSYSFYSRENKAVGFILATAKKKKKKKIWAVT